jgi:DNA-binding response OmpR family regulator
MSPNPRVRILVADDNLVFGGIIKKGLGENGFDAKICYDGDTAWKELNNRNTYDLCLLNFFLPKQNGLELLLKMRRTNTRLPILFVADQTRDEDVISAFRNGADGWMGKPISIPELICRIKVFLKRSGNFPLTEEDGIFKIGESNFNYSEQILTDANGNEIAALSKKATAVLRCFCQKPNVIITRDELLYVCWGKADYFKGRSLDVYLTHIRKLFIDDRTVNLETLHGVGFRFNMPIDK